MHNSRERNRRSTDSGAESFMDLASPTSPTGPWEGESGARARDKAPRLPKIQTSRGGSTYARSDKPPLPTSPKPDFGERRSMSVESRARHKVGGEGRGPSAGAAPSRAELVRKSRKLAQVFGQTPSPLAVCPPGAGQFLLPGLTGKAHRRGFTSVSGDSATSVSRPPSPLVVPTGSAASRRHSTPLSPSDLAALPDMFEASAVRRPSKGKGRREIESDRSSFIDLSEEDSSSQTAGDESDGATLDDGASMLTMTPSELAEDDRRRKREKVAKLHRFLGSRVPASLVLGLNDHQLQQQDHDLPQLPLPVPDPSPNWRPRRRRSSSAAEMKTNWFEPNDRAKDFLDDKEKAINVRRAVKMEKVFGVQPPQTLYHTRPSATLPIPPPPRSPSPGPPPLSPITFRRMSTRSLDRTSVSSSPSPSPGLPPSPTTRNINQSAYINKRAHHRGSRYSPTESTHHLLDYDSDDVTGRQHSNSTSTTASEFGARPVVDAPDGQSAVYMHFRHSLNSLNDIIDRDDKESLAELHRYLISDTLTPDPDDLAPTPTAPDPDARALRSERRRSLPARASVLSLASQFSIAPPEPQMAEFQARRRRAAKLTSFFGVDYRELIGDILESIETGVQEEGSKGALHPAEVQDLLQKLRRLKTKRPGTGGA